MLKHDAAPALAAILALATLPSCREATDTGATEQSAAVSIIDRDAAEYRLVHSGNPALGTVTFLMQVHPIGGETRAELREIGRYQAAILSELFRMDTEHLLLEGYESAVSPDQLEQFIDVAATKARFSSFSSSRALSDEQLLVLGQSGAGLIYAALRGDVHIHPTSDPVFETSVWAAHGALPKLPVFEPLRQHLTMDIREQRCAAAIQAVLAAHAGEGIAVMYGRAHTELPLSIAGPAVRSVDWPSLDAARCHNELIVSEQNPERQLELVRHAPYINDFNFAALLTEEARKAALPKLNVRFESLEDSSPLEQACETEALRLHIRAIWTERKGPFEALRPEFVTERIMSALPSDQAALVAAAPAVEDWSFEFLTEAAQRAAVSRLGTPNPNQGMLDFRVLTEQAKSLEVKSLLRERELRDRDSARMPAHK